MPVLENIDYSPPALLRNPHFNTIYPHLFRKVNGVRYQRERMDTPDGDFLDLDFSKVGSDTLVLVVHGLEGNSERGYMQGMVRAINRNGWDAVAVNQRGCSGEANKLYVSYHSGKTDDLDTAVRYVLQKHHYQHLLLVGFSLGGNIVLKYTGENGSALPPFVKAVAAVSVPCDLKSASVALHHRSNFIYLKRFIRSLKKKALAKKQLFPEAPFTVAQIEGVKDFDDFDNMYTGPAHGFKDAEDYWAKSSSKQFLPRVTVPSLLINALDDSFLAAGCYPFEEARNNPQFHLVTPQFGGHVGFTQNWLLKDDMWHEHQVITFFKEHHP